MLLTDARRPARTDAAGEMVLLADQDRALWDRGRIDEGLEVYAGARASGPSLHVVELNRAVAVAMAGGPDAGLKLIDGVEGLDDYGPYHVARADLLRRLGRP